MAISRHPTSWEEDLADALGGYRPVMLKCVREELAAIASSGGKKGKEAEVALRVSSGFESHPCGKGAVDDELVSAALTMEAIVATVDKGLITALKASRAGWVTLRQGRVWAG